MANDEGVSVGDKVRTVDGRSGYVVAIQGDTVAVDTGSGVIRLHWRDVRRHERQGRPMSADVAPSYTGEQMAAAITMASGDAAEWIAKVRAVDAAYRSHAISHDDYARRRQAVFDAVPDHFRAAVVAACKGPDSSTWSRL